MEEGRPIPGRTLFINLPSWLDVSSCQSVQNILYSHIVDMDPSTSLNITLNWVQRRVRR